MTQKNSNILDLDQVFGKTKPVKVKWKNKEYDLARMDSISPRQALQLQAFQRKANDLNGKKSHTQADIKTMEKLFDDMLNLICNDLPLKEIPFTGKIAIMRFYVEETQGKKALKVALVNMTGATSSRK